MKSLLSLLLVAAVAVILSLGYTSAINDALLSVCEFSSDTYLMEFYPETEDENLLGQFDPTFLEYTELQGFSGIHVNSDQTLWGVALNGLNVLYQFGFTVPIAPGEGASNTVNSASGAGSNEGGATFQTLGAGGLSGTNGFNMSDYEIRLWDAVSYGGLTGDCDGTLYAYDYENRFLQRFYPSSGSGGNVNAFSPVSPFNLAFVNQFASSNNNALVSAWLDAGYYSEDSYYVSPLTLYVAQLDLSKNPPQMNVRSQPFFSYFTVWPWAMDNVEVSSDGNYLYMLAYYVGGYLNTNFTEFDEKTLQQDQRKAMITVLKHSQRMQEDFKRNLGVQTRQQKLHEQKAGISSTYHTVKEMKESMKHLINSLPITVTQTLVTIDRSTLSVVQTQDFDASTFCWTLSLKLNRCYKP